MWPFKKNELLETHTVKEERVECHCGNGVDCPEECCALCECATYEDGVHTKSTCNTPIDCPCHKEEVKEEPTTLEKKYCDDCKKYELGVNCQCVCHGVLPRHQGESETWYKIECRNCGSGKELYYFVEFKPIPYNRINTETRSTEKRCPSCLSLDVEATKI